MSCAGRDPEGVARRTQARRGHEGEVAGIDDTQKIATTLGLGENIPHGAAIYIGSFETDLKDLTAAYTVFPNTGVRKQAYIIERIDDPEHKPIYRAAHVTLPVL